MSELVPTLEQEVRKLAKDLAAELGDDPEPGVLDQEPRFEEAIGRLITGLPQARLVALARDRRRIVTALALAALARTGAAGAGWVRGAIGRVGRVHPLEAAFLLRAIASCANRPVIAEVLGASDHDWTYDPLLTEVGAFLKARVAHGERPTKEELTRALRAEKEALVSEILSELGDAAPTEVRSVFDAWRTTRIDRDFFRTIGRLWEEPAPHLTPVGSREQALQRIEAALAGARPRSLLVVGEHGVGKSAVIAAAVERLRREGWVVFEAGALSINAGASYVGQLEGRVADIASRTEGRRILWVFPRLDEALWAGQHDRSPQGLLDALLPHVESGRIVLLGEVEPGGLEQLIRLRPQVVSAFEVVRLQPLDGGQAAEVAGDWCLAHGVDATPETIAAACELAEHYLAGVAAPGGVLRLLAATAEGGKQIDERALLETLASATGLPLAILDARSPISIDEVRGFLAERVVGQDEAVEVLVQRIAMVKAGLTDPTRPLGVFLFVGPTGTGKTELAKALAEYLFGSADRLVRIDLSEFKTPESFERLLNDDPRAQRGSSLISSVVEQPFSVVLLDEFEKAHPNIWDLFLQLFDDARLTGHSGRTADFRHCVLILTSNVGAAIQAGSSPGFTSRGAEFNPDRVARELQKSFRPELLNRIDRVVVFRPLEREQMRSILRHELEGVLDRRGFRMHPWAVEWDDAAVEFLLDQGFSAELGARPLKRAIEEHLLAPLALAIVDRRVPAGEQFLFISARDGAGIDVLFVDPDAEEAAAAPVDGDQPTVERLALEPAASPRAAAFLAELAEEVFEAVGRRRADKEHALARTREPGFWDDPNRFETLAEAEYLDRLDAASRTAEGLFRRLAAREAAPAATLVGLLAERLYLLRAACRGLEVGEAADAYLAVEATPGDRRARAFAVRLREMYLAWAGKRGMRVADLSARGDASLLAVSGLAAFSILSAENGLHVLESPRGERGFERATVRVAVAPRRPRAGENEDAAAARAALEEPSRARSVVRRYRERPSPLVRDTARGWRTGRLERVLGGDFDLIGA